MIHKIYTYYLTKSKNQGHRLSRIIHWQLYLLLKQRLVKYYSSKKLNLKNHSVDTTSNVVVSLTSFPERIETVHLAIKSMLNQTIKPKKIVLWLGADSFLEKENSLPKQVLELKKFGLEIEFCEDLKPHTKYYYAFKKYPSNLIVTVDDDIIYPKTLLQKLIEFHTKFPNSIIANRVRELSFKNNTLETYRNWKINSTTLQKPSLKLIATGVGGVLYNPNFFSEKLLDKNAIKTLAITVDDLWLKADQLANNIFVTYTQYYKNSFIEIPNSQIKTLHLNNVFEDNNSIVFTKLLEHFNIDIKSIF